MKRVIFLQSNTFIARELFNALSSNASCILTTIAIDPEPTQLQCQYAFETVYHILPAIVISINDAGYDLGGFLQKQFIASGCYLINWYIDFPLYDHIFKNRIHLPHNQRLDFVSDPCFGPLLEKYGYTYQFLPLATDPLYFSPPQTPISHYDRNIAFVGNSSLELLDTLVDASIAPHIENHTPLLHKLKKKYYENPYFSIRSFLYNNTSVWKPQLTIEEDKFVFIMEWMVGYLYRKDCIQKIHANNPDHCTIFGDAYWTRFIPPHATSTEACYYDNLCSIYQRTKINININRIQIATGLTQRHFDCKASQAFLLTDDRLLVSKFFITQGDNKEMVTFRTMSECLSLITYYLNNDAEREEIAQRGADKIFMYHTYAHRLETIFSTCKSLWAI